MAQSKFKAWRFAGIVAASAVVGYFVGKALPRDDLDLWIGAGSTPPPSVLIALAVAVIYVLIGGLLAIGTLAPRAGVVVLTGVEEDDLRDSRRLYLIQAVVSILFGAALAILALSGSAAPVSATTGALIFSALTLAGLALYAVGLPLLDEFMKVATMEAVAISYGLTLIVICGWAVLAHANLVAAPALIELVTIFWIVSLAASFLAGARRGLIAE